ncbi:TetR/AcrR family transcriptional regulator [Sinirhodobacter populi]|uniref:TetR/AcrR family transcriptional regulator n=2 Tax=Paenirhodobacter populi TaxID=2306993 RepID=A0A443K681_9RHOB|nr:TetR/AcrR family transcriptional regulator [Sinirhodobacter populi]
MPRARPGLLQRNPAMSQPSLTLLPICAMVAHRESAIQSGSSEMPTTSTADPAPTTRQRILETAIRRFARSSYDDTGLRDIAADVGVDVAYVHRCFGSKEQLFLEVLKRMSDHPGLAAAPRDELPAFLARQLFERGTASAEGQPDPLLVLIRSLGVPAAAGPVGERLDSLFVAPLSEKLGEDGALRASMVMALLIGLRMMRDFLKLPQVAGADPQEAERVLTEVLAQIMTPRCACATPVPPAEAP